MTNEEKAKYFLDSGLYEILEKHFKENYPTPPSEPDADKVDKSRCPCGGIILADTDECRVPVCIECCIEISKSYLNMDENYNEGFMRGMDAAKVELPTLEEVELHLDGCTEYNLGVQDCYRFIKARVEWALKRNRG